MGSAIKILKASSRLAAAISADRPFLDKVLSRSLHPAAIIGPDRAGRKISLTDMLKPSQTGQKR
jgi:hypothetical protein